MTSASRFDCASSPLVLRELLGKARRVFWTCLGLGIAIHLSSARIGGIHTQQTVAKPLTTQFIKRQPRLTKPLELKKRPQPRRRTVQRKMVAVKARAERGQRGVGFQPTQMLRGLARPSADIRRAAALGTTYMDPAAVAGIIEGTKEIEQRIDMSLELLDIQSLNTGQYHALVVQDAADKRNVKGFCRLAVVYSEAMSARLYGNSGQTYFELFVRPVVRNLAEAMNRYTDVKTDVFGQITLDDAELLKTPWVYFMSHFNFRLSDSELGGLGRYLKYGGFVFSDTIPGLLAYRSGFHAIVGSITAALELQGIPKPTFQKLPSSHPIYHCYFDFDGPPIAGDAPVAGNREYNLSPTDYLEGMEVDGRLSVVLSRKAYYCPWVGDSGSPPATFYGGLDSGPALRFGANLIVFALTQEGSVTHRLLQSVDY